MHGDGLSVARGPDGDVIDISTLSALKASGSPRPKTFCLTCQRQLIPRLGQIKKHHFGHAPTQEGMETCWASKPEGETHLSAKRKIAQLLEAWCDKSLRVWTRRPCHQCGHLHSSGPPQTEARLIDLHPDMRVVVEGWGDPTRQIRPDVQVLDSFGAPVLFVEVKVSHANTEEKIRLVRQMGVPMIEISGKSILEDVNERPSLPFVGLWNVSKPGCCESCRVGNESKEKLERMSALALSLGVTFNRSRRKISAEYDAPSEQRPRNPWTMFAKCLVNFCVEGRTIAKTALTAHVKLDAGKRRVILGHSQIIVAKGQGSMMHMPLSLERLSEGTTNYQGCDIEIRKSQLLWEAKIGSGDAAEELKQMRAAARAWSMALAKELGGADVLTFGGFFATSDRRRIATYCRVDMPAGGWSTAYPTTEVEQVVGKDCDLLLRRRWSDIVQATEVDRWLAANRVPIVVPDLKESESTKVSNVTGANAMLGLKNRGMTVRAFKVPSV